MKFLGNMLAMLLLMTSIGAGASTQSTERTHIVQALADAMAANYVFPNAALRYGAALREQQSELGEFVGSDDEFGRYLTATLQAIHPDSHLRLFSPGPVEEDSEAIVQRNTELPPAIEDQRLITPEIAYIRFNLFPGDAETLVELQAFLEAHRGIENLIIDVRGHRGGGLAEIDMFNMHLFSQETLLLVMETRAAAENADVAPAPQGVTIRQISSSEDTVRRQHWAIPAARPLLQDTAVFILTSDYTASAAEHMVAALQRTGRATIIGEATRGGGHFGGTIQLPGGFAVFVPVGRTYDPVTGEGWEGDGVAPDYTCRAGNALTAALIQIGLERADARAHNSAINYVPPRGSRSNSAQ